MQNVCTCTTGLNEKMPGSSPLTVTMQVLFSIFYCNITHRQCFHTRGVIRIDEGAQVEHTTLSLIKTHRICSAVDLSHIKDEPRGEEEGVFLEC